MHQKQPPAKVAMACPASGAGARAVPVEFVEAPVGREVGSVLWPVLQAAVTLSRVSTNERASRFMVFRRVARVATVLHR
jgi:hypothetical protein